MEKPKLYVKPLCQNHQKELSMCCIDCYSMKCAACPINKDCRKKGKWVLWANGEISKPEIQKFTIQLRIFFHFGWKNYGSYMLAILLLGLFFQNLPIISRGIIYITSFRLYKPTKIINLGVSPRNVIFIFFTIFWGFVGSPVFNSVTQTSQLPLDGVQSSTCKCSNRPGSLQGALA